MENNPHQNVNLESQNDKTLYLDLILSKENQLEFGQANQEKSLTVVTVINSLSNHSVMLIKSVEFMQGDSSIKQGLPRWSAKD